MRFKEIASRLTGISVPIFGVQWNPSEPEVSKARRIITFLEDRRVLFRPESLEVPEHCVESVIKIRDFLTSELSTISEASELSNCVRAMRAACRKFVDSVGGIHSEIIHLSRRDGHWATWRFYPALGEMRGVFGVYLAIISAAYGIDIEDDLASIIPVGDEKTITP